jgi:hypothetical protein
MLTSCLLTVCHLTLYPPIFSIDPTPWVPKPHYGLVLGTNGNHVCILHASRIQSNACCADQECKPRGDGRRPRFSAQLCHLTGTRACGRTGNRVIEDRVPATFHDAPYAALPHLLTITECVHSSRPQKTLMQHTFLT